jgi:hypothetical protein
VFEWDLPFSGGSSAPVVAKVEFCTGLPSSTWSMLVMPAFASLAVAEVLALISVLRFQYVGEAVRRCWLLRHCFGDDLWISFGSSFFSPCCLQSAARWTAAAADEAELRRTFACVFTYFHFLRGSSYNMDL